MQQWIIENKVKSLALAIALLYILTALFWGDEGDSLRVIIFLILPLSGIFFGDYLGGYTGFSGLAQPHITKPTPGYWVSFICWTLLLLPFIAIIIRLFS